MGIIALAIKYSANMAYIMRATTAPHRPSINSKNVQFVLDERIQIAQITTACNAIFAIAGNNRALPQMCDICVGYNNSFNDVL
jgi:hypothetical protein